MENNIEESIKIMEHWIEYEKNNKEKINRADELINIQETILSAYKRVLKEKNRLEEQVEYDKTHIYTPQTIELNFILKSKIEDKIEKLNSESYAEKLEDMMNTKNYTITELVQYVLQELLDGSDTNVGSIGNSIEEDIERLKLCSTNQCNICGRYEKEECMLERNRCEQHILSDYKKVLKENEILKEEKEQAWEEWNNLEQGSYGTEQKLKQQIKELRKENEELKNKFNLKQFDVNIVYNDYLEKLDEYERNNIPKSKLKDIIDRIDYDIKKTKEIISKNTNIYASYRKNDYQIVRLRAMNTKSLDIKKRLQELLERRNNNEII